MNARFTIWTVGHSTRPLDEFLALLAQHELQAVADVRRFAGSRRHPQYSEGALRGALGERAIRYVAFPSLGGRRRARADSRNLVWRNPSFRGYADHMESAEFAAGLQELVALGASVRTTLMCAEAVWWRCHRALISDALKADGIDVVHILDAKTATPHPYTAAARVVDGRLSYRGPTEDLF